MKFSKPSWLMWSALLPPGCAMGIPAPKASAFTMATSSMACRAIPAVASATWTNKDELSREIMAARPATKYSACTVEIYNVPEMKWQEVLLDTGAARTPMPLETRWHTIRKHGTKTLKNLQLIRATGAVRSASEETTLEFKFTVGGPTHKMPTRVGGVGSLPMLGANFWGKAGANIDFPSRTVKIGNEVVSSTASCAALVQATAAVKISAHLPKAVWLPPGKRMDAICCLSNGPESVAEARRFEAVPSSTGLWGKSRDAFLPNSLIA